MSAQTVASFGKNGTLEGFSKVFRYLVANLLGQSIGNCESNGIKPTIFKLGWDFSPVAVGCNARVTSAGKLKDVLSVSTISIANGIKIFSVR